jgi:hypothetical protein
MKKRNLLIAVLLVLSLSVVIMGCKEEEFNPAVPANVKTILQTMGYTGPLHEPADTNYVGYYCDNESNPTELTIVWKDADSGKYNDYKAKWGSAAAYIAPSGQRAIAVSSSAVLTLAGLDTALIGFSSTGGTEGTLTAPANSIVFAAAK